MRTKFKSKGFKLFALLFIFSIMFLSAVLFAFGHKNILTASAAPNITSPKMNYVVRHYLDGEVASERTSVGSFWGLYHSESKGITYFGLTIKNQVVRPIDHSHDGEYGTGFNYNDISIVYDAGSLNKTLIL